MKRLKLKKSTDDIELVDIGKHIVSRWPFRVLSFPDFIFTGLILSLWFLLFYPEIVPFWDYPPHLSRLHILKLDGMDPIIEKYFSVDWNYVPNLALDLFSYPLLQFLEADAVIRIFICAGFLISASGTIYLHRALGGKGLWPYVVFLFLINDILVFGFLSFVFSNGLAVWAFAFWIKSRKIHYWRKLCIFALVALALLTAHLFAFCVYALLVGSYEIAALFERYKDKEKIFSANFVIGALHFLPSLLLFFLISETSDNAPISVGTVMQKLAGLASVVSLYDIDIQLAVVALICIFIILLLLSKGANVAPRMYVFMIFGILLFIVAPGSAFGSFFLDHRMPIGLLLPFIASIQFKEIRMKTSYCWMALVVACLTQYIYIGIQWEKFDRIYSDMFVVTNDLKAGDKLLHYTLEKERFSENIAPPLIRLPEHLLVTKGVISPFVFADARHQPISYHGPVPLGVGGYPMFRLFDKNSMQIDSIRIKKFKDDLDAELSVDMDYLLLIDFDREFIAQSKVWQLYSDEGVFRLYKKIDKSKLSP